MSGEKREINQGRETNDLLAVCHENYLALYVNEELIMETTDNTFDEGTFGFTATIYEADETLEIAFDDLQIFRSVEQAGQPTMLESYGGDWRDAIAELEDLDLIGSGGSLIFNENRVFFDGIGYWFEPLARNSSQRDVVMAATLNFTTSNTDDLEICGLMARIAPSSELSINTYLEVGLDNFGNVYWFDVRDYDAEDTEFDEVRVNPDLDEPHHLLFIATSDRLTVYFDGELIFNQVEIESRNGSFGLTLIGEGAASRCEGSNVWAYSAPTIIEGLCEAFASNTVNQRSRPGTNFDRAGSLSSGEQAEIIGQAEGSDGFTWYQLDDEVWVREDVISLRGDCNDIPEVDD